MKLKNGKFVAKWNRRIAKLATNIYVYRTLQILLFLLSIKLLYNRYKEKTKPTRFIQEIEPSFTLLGPGSEANLTTKDVYNQLIDIKDFKFLIKPAPCPKYPTGLLLIILVPSTPSNYERRSIIRNTWGQTKEFTKVLFLLGTMDNIAVKHSVEQENMAFHDIIQGSFVDAYRNMTYKHLMGLKWVVHHCGAARYVLKADDDVVVNSRELWRFLVRELSPWGARGLILCNVLRNMPVIRDPTGPFRRWMVLQKEFKGKIYPPYCSGPFVIYSMDVLLKVVEKTQNMRYFWIDDVHITGRALENTGVKHTGLGRWYVPWEIYEKIRKKQVKFDKHFLLAPLMVNPKLMKEMWQKILDLY